MPAQWTGELVGKMHIYGVSCRELADRIGCSNKWLSMVINGHRNSKNAEQRFMAALPSGSRHPSCSMWRRV